MNSRFNALIWEICRKNRWGFAAILTLFIGCASLRMYVQHLDADAAESWRHAALGWSAVLLGFSLLVVFGIFGCAEPHPMRGFTGIPPRRFTLPLTASGLVGPPLAFGALTIAVVYLAWSWAVFPGLLPEGIQMPDLYLTALLLSSLAVFQALVWLFPSFPRIRAILVIVLVLGIFPLAALPFVAQQRAAMESMPWWQTGWPVAYGVVWILAILAAWQGVSLERQGGWSHLERRSAAAELIARWMPRPVDFHSPFAAQFWIEWRRNCRFPLFVWTILASAAFVFSVTFAAKSASPEVEYDATTDLLSGILLPLVIGWTAITGLMLARDTGSKKLAFSSFTATRPIPIGSLLAAKLLAGFGAWLCALLIFGLMTGLCIQFGVIHLHQANPAIWWSIAFVLALSLHLFTGILPLSLTGRIPGFPWSMLPLLLIYGGVLNVVIWCEEHPRFWNVISASVIILIVLKFLVSAWAFRRALAFRWISRGFVLGYALFWISATTVLVRITWGTVERVWWQRESIFLIGLAVGLVPLTRIALSPMALAMNRHR